MKIPDLEPLLPPLPPHPTINTEDTTTLTSNATTFTTPYTFPHGLLLQQNFITPAHEADLIENVFRKQLDWPDRKGRLSLHYGYTFSYKTFGVDEDIPFKEFPEWLVPLIPLLPVREGDEGEIEDQARLVGLLAGEAERERDDGGGGRADEEMRETGSKGRITKGRPPDQVCLQYYAPGTGIPPHVDTHSTYDELYALSLGAPVMMQFRRDYEDTPSPIQPSTEKQHQRQQQISGSATGIPSPSPSPSPTTMRRTQLDIDLPPRSMLCMSSDSRLHWTHGIKSRKTDTLPDGTVRPRGDRWSITYRWLRRPRPFDPARDPPHPTGPADYSKSNGKNDAEETAERFARDGSKEESSKTENRQQQQQQQKDKPRMVRECECGDLALCDTAQRRQGREREYRWKGYEKSGGGALASQPQLVS